MRRTELLEAFKTERVRFEKTREIQWKFNLAIWTLEALGIHYLNKEMFTCKCLLVISAIVFIGCHLTFCILMQRGIIASRTLSNQMLDTLNKPINFSPNSPKDDPEIDFSTRRIENIQWTQSDILWIIFQVLGSMVLISIMLMKLL
jgi:hypothetical protein